MYLSVIYNGEPHEVKITEETTRKLYGERLTNCTG